MKRRNVVIGVIGADPHTIGNKVIEFALLSAGFNVLNLGAQVSRREFIDAAAKIKADAILVSSIYGHGELDSKGLREKCEKAGLKNILLYIGGNLTVGKRDDVETRFKEMGFDRVYPKGASIEKAINDLECDLKSR